MNLWNYPGTQVMYFGSSGEPGAGNQQALEFSAVSVPTAQVRSLGWLFEFKIFIIEALDISIILQ